MTAVRRRLCSIGLLLLLFQAAGFAMGPIASCWTNTTQSADDPDDCCKGMAPGQMCPLHHRRAPSNDSSRHHDDGSTPSLRCGCSSIDPALISLSFGLAVLPPAVSLDVTPVSSDVIRLIESPLEYPTRLDTPPPRS